MSCFCYFSDDSLDSELEAELYQNVHFASSLVETPTNNSKGILKLI
jgi:hypothetical protein